ncbi:MAG: Gfo/Idh/MocA family oxidoreductase [Planctomycetes bacterium]|jgi:predicted dehydrogenase|nr:Gfo/Idh/MocA family oxidoreductase [Planctomycetota bacterium]
MSSRGTSRRDFLLGSAAAGSTLLGSRPLLAAPIRSRSPNARLRLGVVGCGGKGLSDMQACAKTHDIVALCDVDHGKAKQAREEQPKAAFYEDWRDLLDREKLDGLVVSTPDHSHAGPALAAMALGMHVFVQKPLSHTVHEARLLRDAARKSGVITSMGNQGTCLDGFRTAAECVRAGVIGKVTDVHVWTDRPIWPQGIGRPKHIDAIPATFRWDLWLGPAAWRPYASGRKDGDFKGYAPFHWRAWWDFGTGALGDMACHVANLPFFALELDAPSWVESVAEGSSDETAPKRATIRFGFPARGNRGPVTMHWYDGGDLPPASLLPGIKLRSGGFLLQGDQGLLYSPTDYGETFEIWRDGKSVPFEAPAQVLPRSPGVHDEWLQGILNKTQPMANFEYAAPFTEAMLLGNLALRTGQRIEWDAAALRVTNSEVAQRLIGKTYRRGFELTKV